MQDYYMAQSNIKNWCCNVWQVLHNLKYEDSFHRRTPCDIDTCRERLFSLQQEKWQLDLTKKPKLRFYKMFKNEMKTENYVLSRMSRSERSITAQIRAGILPIFIETGRFKNITLNDRICSFCSINEVEDEIHFMFKCTLYNDLRYQWLLKVKQETIDFDSLDIQQKLNIVFTKNYHCTAKFLLRSFNLRKDKLYSLQ